MLEPSGRDSQGPVGEDVPSPWCQPTKLKDFCRRSKISITSHMLHEETKWMKRCLQQNLDRVLLFSKISTCNLQAVYCYGENELLHDYNYYRTKYKMSLKTFAGKWIGLSIIDVLVFISVSSFVGHIVSIFSPRNRFRKEN